jgi:hypothetical protein
MRARLEHPNLTVRDLEYRPQDRAERNDYALEAAR